MNLPYEAADFDAVYSFGALGEFSVPREFLRKRCVSVSREPRCWLGTVTSSHVIEHMAVNRINEVVVNISSVAARGNPGQTADSAASSGLEAMTRVWPKELGPFGIRAFAIILDFIDTLSTRRALP